jgi:hypothetical protein
VSLLQREPGPVASALAPLHASYLRRLAEMAARIAPASLLLEATTRDERGRLVLGADGFPLRFDVANLTSGETFEVRSGLLDAPSVERLVVGMLDVDLLPGAWEAFWVACRFDGLPMPEDARALCDLLRAFAEVGVQGGFSPRGAAAPWSGRIHGAQVESRSDEVFALFDLGTCPPAALEVLADALDRFGQDRAPLAKLTLGGAVE